MSLNIKDLLYDEHSKRNTSKIVAHIESGDVTIETLFEIFNSTEVILVQRSAMVINDYLTRHPDLIPNYISHLLETLPKRVHDAVPRNVFRILSFADIPEKYEGQMLDLGYQYFLNPSEAIAVRVFALQVLFNISQKYEELKPELLSAMELIEAPSAGLISRMRRLKKKLLT